jgi:hypothetical protein
MATIDLTAASGGEFAKLMDVATRLGVAHETGGDPELAKKAVAARFCTGYRIFHADALFAAYKAGRDHVRTMGD